MLETRSGWPARRGGPGGRGWGFGCTRRMPRRRSSTASGNGRVCRATWRPVTSLPFRSSYRHSIHLAITTWCATLSPRRSRGSPTSTRRRRGCDCASTRSRPVEPDLGPPNPAAVRGRARRYGSKTVAEAIAGSTRRVFSSPEDFARLVADALLGLVEVVERFLGCHQVIDSVAHGLALAVGATVLR